MEEAFYDCFPPLFYIGVDKEALVVDIWESPRDWNDSSPAL